MRSSRNGAQRRGPLFTVLALASLVLPLACGETSEQSLCEVYDDFLSARAEVQAIDPESKSAAEATDIADEYLAQVRRLRETDSRYSQAVDDLDLAVADVVRVLNSVDPDADYTIWAPLVADDFEEAAKAADRVEELIGPICTPELES